MQNMILNAEQFSNLNSNNIKITLNRLGGKIIPNLDLPSLDLNE